MTDNIVSPLTADELMCLRLMSEGMPLIDMGKHSRWSEPLQSLARRGLVDGRDKFNTVLTDAGRAALGAKETDEEAELDKAIRDAVIKNSKIAAIKITDGEVINRITIQIFGHPFVDVLFREHPWGDKNMLVLELPKEANGCVVLPKHLFTNGGKP